MSSATNRSDTKILRYAIGASTLVLALMLFSQVSCSILGYCADWFGIPILGFWEVLGILTALLFGYFSIRSLRRTPPENKNLRNSDSPDREVTDPSLFNVRDITIQERTRERWQSICDHLSEEEKSRLRTLLEQRVITPGTGGGSGPAGTAPLSSPGSDSRGS